MNTILRERSLGGTVSGFKKNHWGKQILPKAPRYFEHQARSCIKVRNRNKCKKKRNPCYICAGYGHHGNYCPLKDKLDSVEDNHNIKICLKCGSTGHDMFSCVTDYDFEDLKTIQCYSCKEFGHLCCSENNIKESSQTSCYNCGESSHYGFECTKLKEAADNLKTELPFSRSRRLVHFPQVGKLDNKGTAAGKVKGKDVVAEKLVNGKPHKARRKKKKRKLCQQDAIQSGPSHSTSIFGLHCGKPESNVWLPPEPATRNIFDSSSGLGHPSFQLGVHLSHHSTIHQTGISNPQTLFNSHSSHPHETFHLANPFLLTSPHNGIAFHPPQYGGQLHNPLIGGQFHHPLIRGQFHHPRIGVQFHHPQHGVQFHHPQHGVQFHHPQHGILFPR